MALSALVFVFSYVAGIALAFIRHPVWGLYTYVMVYYLDAPNRWWGNSLPGVRWSLVIAAATLLSVLFHRREVRDRWINHGPILIVVMYTAWMWLQYLWTITGDDHDLGVEYFTKYLVVLYLVYTLVDNRNRVLSFLFVHVLGCFYLALVAWITYDGGRLDGIGGAGIDDANSLGVQLGTAVVCAAALYLTFTDWRKWVVAASIPFLLNAIVMTGSRGAFLALLVGAAAMFHMRPPTQFSKIAVYVVAGSLVFGYVASDFFWERMSTLRSVEDQEDLDQSAATRLEIIKQQWDMAKAYPFGAGHKGTAALSYQYLSDEHMSAQGGRSSHNVIMSSLVDQGFFGLFLWLLLMLLLWRRIVRLRKSFVANTDLDLAWITAGLSGVLGAYWIGGLFAPLMKAEVYIWVIALICSLRSLVNFNERAGQTGKSSSISTEPT